MSIAQEKHRRRIAPEALNGHDMKKITLDLTFEELKALTSLASDQLFRREFIDPKMPGYVRNPEELSLGKSVVARMRLMVVEEGLPRATSARG